MPQNLQKQTQRQAEEAISCNKVQNVKAIEHNRQNIIKFQTRPENKNGQNFVLLNKRKTFEKLGRKVLDNTVEFENQGFSMLFV